MGQINIHSPENQFPRAGVRFFLKEVAKPAFQNFNRALNKKILFPIDRKSVSTSWNEELIKKHVSTLLKNCFHSQEYLTNEKMVSTRSNKVFL